MKLFIERLLHLDTDGIVGTPLDCVDHTFSPQFSPWLWIYSCDFNFDRFLLILNISSLPHHKCYLRRISSNWFNINIISSRHNLTILLSIVVNQRKFTSTKCQDVKNLQTWKFSPSLTFSNRWCRESFPLLHNNSSISLLRKFLRNLKFHHTCRIWNRRASPHYVSTDRPHSQEQGEHVKFLRQHDGPTSIHFFTSTKT